MIRWHHSLINYILDFCDEKASLVKAFALEGRIITCRKYNIFNNRSLNWDKITPNLQKIIHGTY